MDKKLQGAWLVHHTNKLQDVTSQRGFENIHLAGKAGILLSAISATESASLAINKIHGLAETANINITFELPTLLDVLENERLIISAQHGVEVLGVTSSSVLEHSANIFLNREPKPQEFAALALAERASITPISAHIAKEYCSDTFILSTADTAEFLNQSKEIGFVDVESLEPNDEILFNGNLFRREDAKKMNAIFGSLKQAEHDKVLEMDEMLKVQKCINLDTVKKKLGDALFSKLHSVGVYDVNGVDNEREKIWYVTRPGAFSKYGNSIVEDAFDLAKAFVSSLEYGMTRSPGQRGRIRMIGALMSRLIQGDWVGPATAIGQDYKVLEMKGVLEISYETSGMFSMRLLKREIGELALQVISSGDASEESLPNFPGATVTRYFSPESTRVISRRKQSSLSKKATAEILRSLRTGGI